MAAGSGSLSQRSTALSLFISAGEGHCLGEIRYKSGKKSHNSLVLTCQVCRKGDNDECLLLCDGCDRGCHMYCLKPKITQDPSKKRTRVKKRRYEEDSSEDETTRRRSVGMTTRHKETPTPSSSTRYSGEGAGSKRRRMTTRNQPDLTFCE
ncbi:hypothetical protein GOODEAATRI_012682 [Goodea atripinnis]|uniref:PHD-type domain-containing protein n=1 Tax=Goodea atripinnis TaxID=208336 RepID=A0ABV0PN45_9TELE